MREYFLEAETELNLFLKRWTIEKIKKMTLEEYNSLGNKDSFSYWLEHRSVSLGAIGGTPSNKFGIWEMQNIIDGTSKEFYHDGKYKWYRKYGKTSEEAFEKVKELVLQIVISSLNNEFEKINLIDYFALSKWKIAYVFSKNNLLPIYKSDILRRIADNLDYQNYNKASISELNSFIISKKEVGQYFFDFASRHYEIAIKKHTVNYYIIGSKYEDEKGGNTVDISSKMYERNVISIGFFWNEDLSHLYGKPRYKIENWLDKKLQSKYPEKYSTAKKSLSFFLGINEGDIIAIKSHGRYGKLTIIGYAEVVAINNEVYSHNPKELGHCLNVNFLEKGLYQETGLSYGNTIHKIIPNQREGHFQQIFKGYSFLENTENESEYFELTESRINEKQTESKEITVAYSTIVNKTHNKIQTAFALHLQKKFPKDIIRTEHRFIDVFRQNNDGLFYYEIKPYNTAYSCIRSAIGQLLDYYHSNLHTEKKIHIRVVGPAEVTNQDIKFIEFLKKSLSISFDYIAFKNSLN